MPCHLSGARLPGIIFPGVARPLHPSDTSDPSDRSVGERTPRLSHQRCRHSSAQAIGLGTRPPQTSCALKGQHTSNSIVGGCSGWSAMDFGDAAFAPRKLYGSGVWNSDAMPARPDLSQFEIPHRSCGCICGAATTPVAVNLVMSFWCWRKPSPTCFSELTPCSLRLLEPLPC